MVHTPKKRGKQEETSQHREQKSNITSVHDNLFGIHNHDISSTYEAPSYLLQTTTKSLTRMTASEAGSMSCAGSLLSTAKAHDCC